jgi:transcriptional regulator with PAS, ATPase and Fis domain/predicted negative regulator of RcsB-dependent stress response
MKNKVSPASEELMSKFELLLELQQGEEGGAKRAYAGDFDELVGSLAAGAYRSGFTANLEKFSEVLTSYCFDADQKSRLYCILSTILLYNGYSDLGLRAVTGFEAPSVFSGLKASNQAWVHTQLGLAYAKNGDLPRAVTLLNDAAQLAEKKDLIENLACIYLSSAFVYSRLNEHPIARNFGERGMKFARETGDLPHLVMAYRLIGNSYEYEGNFQKALDYLNQAIKFIGDKPLPMLAGLVYCDIAAALSFLQRPKDSIAAARKAISLLEELGNKNWLSLAYNNLGNNLISIGNRPKAAEAISQAIELGNDIESPLLAAFLDSMGGLEFHFGNEEAALEYFGKACERAELDGQNWYSVQSLKNRARTLLSLGRLDEAVDSARKALDKCESFSERYFSNLAKLVLAECLILKDEIDEASELIDLVEESDVASDVFAIGQAAKLRGMLAERAGDHKVAIQHYSRSLSAFEMTENLYYKASAELQLGVSLSGTQTDKAFKHLSSAVEIFGKLGVESHRAEAQTALDKLAEAPASQQREGSASSNLLMMRLAEAVSSRELLFRELVTIVQQETRATKIILAELDENKRFQPSVIDGFIPGESVDLLAKLNDAKIKNDLENFAIEKNIGAFQLKTSNSAPAMLIVYPRSAAVLADGAELPPLLRVVELGLDICALREKNKETHTEYESGSLASQSILPGFIHTSPAMTSLVEEVYRIRSSDVTVLITGESGTGKELVSRAIHALSSRKNKIFVPFNCTAVPKELTEGHLFGYKRGAFTGAQNDSPGMIRSADGGTLFLDEIGDLALDVQPKILRFLQEGEVQPLGEKSPVRVDVRIIAATNMNLEDKVAQGQFREDLYYRLNVIRLRVPPLRERKSEIPQIVNYYINHYSSKFGRKNLSISQQTMDMLIAHNWEGNVRQLCNEVQRLVARADNGEKITPSHLSPDVIRAVETQAPVPRFNTGGIRSLNLSGSYQIESQGKTLDAAVSELEIQMITDSLNRHHGNKSKVAKELGLTRRGLYLKLDRYNLEKPGKRSVA